MTATTSSALSTLGLALREHAHPLSTVQPEAPLDDLHALTKIVGDARVVLLGESVHSVPAFLKLRHRFLRHLVTELGFTALITETGFPEGLEVSEQIADPKTENGGAGSEPAALYAWLRHHNAKTDRPVRFYGMDLAASAGSLRRPGLLRALSLLDVVDPKVAVRLRRRTEQLLQQVGDGALDLAAYRKAPLQSRCELTALIADLISRLSSESITYSQKASREACEIALRCAISARQADDHIRATADDRPFPRDAAMAENIAWILGREERILVHAHNLHIQRWPQTLPGIRSVTTVGQHLAAGLAPEELVVIGTTFTTGRMQSAPPASVLAKLALGRIGIEELITSIPIEEVGAPPPGTADAVLTEAGPSNYLVDLREIPTSGPVAEALSAAHSVRTNDRPLEVPIRTAFDAIVHINRIEQVLPSTEEIARLMKAAGLGDAEGGAGRQFLRLALVQLAAGLRRKLRRR